MTNRLLKHIDVLRTCWLLSMTWCCGTVSSTSTVCYSSKDMYRWHRMMYLQEIFKIVTDLVTHRTLFSAIFLQSCSLFHESGSRSRDTYPWSLRLEPNVKWIGPRWGNIVIQNFPNERWSVGRSVGRRLLEPRSVVNMAKVCHKFLSISSPKYWPIFKIFSPAHAAEKLQ